MSDQKHPYPSRTADQFVVRFPDGMRDRLKEAAYTSGRSMNAEIVARLEGSFEPAPAELQKDLEHLQQQLRDCKYTLKMGAALGAMTALALKTLATQVPEEFRVRIGADSAEKMADSVLTKGLPDDETLRWDPSAEGVIEMFDGLLEEIRLTAGVVGKSATVDTARTSGGDEHQRRIKIRRPEQP